MKRAIIIGNGFDLALGAKTSFNNFLESPQFLNISQENSLVQFYNQEIGRDENWSDLEGSLEEWEAWLNTRDHKAEAAYKRSAHDRIREDFFEMQEAIRVFIRCNRLQLRTRDNRELEDLVSAWYSTPKVMVYSFNYTSTFHEYLGFVAAVRGFKPTFDIQYMHGTVDDNNAVFGTTEHALSNEFKFAAKVVSVESQPSFKSLLKDSTDIEIFGHSLGKSDWNYFNYLFERCLEMKDSAPRVRIYTKSREDIATIRTNISNMRKGLFSDLTNNGLQPEIFASSEIFERRNGKFSPLLDLIQDGKEIIA